MGEREIDLERIVSDPAYRRRIIDYLNGRTRPREAEGDRFSHAAETSPRRAAAGN
ncbi:MAG: hypothetical protein K8F57_01730 [Alphaproteobacteria bacterium]|nr:hypothetical protein [Alphaproteobacteria bacterium]